MDHLARRRRDEARETAIRAWRGSDRVFQKSSKGHVVLHALMLILLAPFFVFWQDWASRPGRTTLEPPAALSTVRIPRTTGVIVIDRDGRVRVSTGDEMSLPVQTASELWTFCQNYREAYPTRPVVLRIDRRTRFASVNLVLAALSDAGINGGFFFVWQKHVDEHAAP